MELESASGGRPEVPTVDGVCVDNDDLERLEGKLADEVADDPVESYNVLGITVGDIDHKTKLEKLFRLSIMWLVVVCIDHTANLVQVLVNADGLQECRDANTFTKAETMDSQAFRAVLIVGYLISFGVTFSIPMLAYVGCLLYTSPSPRDRQKSRMPSSA